MATISVWRVNPLPFRTRVCPGLAEAWAGAAGVPLRATAVIWVKPTVKGADVPPAVVTVTGPKS